MYAITGITGQVGGAVAERLLGGHLPVRAVVRDVQKGAVWAGRGCEVALANLKDAAALTKAFTGTEGVFVLLPPLFDPAPDFPAEAQVFIAALRTALAAAHPARVVCLSTIGAPAIQPSLLTPLGTLERELGALPLPMTFLRAAWFMENFAWDVAPAKERGVIPSFLQPLDMPVPMVATADIGRVAAALLQERGDVQRVVELEGPRRFTPNDIAAAFSAVLHRPIRVEAVPRASWTEQFTASGIKNPTPRIQMLDGLNEGWIAFEGNEASTVKGEIMPETVLQRLADR